MDRPNLVVLDVGHGNAAVLLDTGGVVVIDTGKGGVLLDFLRKTEINQVDVLLISHADADHIRNAPDLLLDEKIVVKRLYFNTDASKQSQLWQDFKIAIRNARRKKGLVAEPHLTTTQTGRLDCGQVHIEVLYPPPEDAVTGPGGKAVGGLPITSNSMSAVIRLNTEHGPMVLLAGDVERGCLDQWMEESKAPVAKVLVFPHHGGNPGDENAADFAVDLMKMVKPEIVIFSIHRSHYHLPRPEVLDVIRRDFPEVRVLCTQLSAHCVDPVPAVSLAHLNEHPAQGKEAGNCCAGTIAIDLSRKQGALLPLVDEHLGFIRSLHGDPLCIRKPAAAAVAIGAGD